MSSTDLIHAATEKPAPPATKFTRRFPIPIKHITRTTYTHSKGLFGEFTTFINRGNAIDLAVGIVIGAAFTSIVSSIVNDIIGPILGLAVGTQLSEATVVIGHNANASQPHRWSYKTRDEAKSDGAVTINYGNVIQQCINFLIIGIIVFVLVKFVNGLRPRKKKEDEKSTDCTYCEKEVSFKAKRCPHCTSWLVMEGEPTQAVDPTEQVPSQMI